MEGCAEAGLLHTPRGCHPRVGSLQHCSTAGHCVVTVLTEHWLHCSAVSLSAARLHAATSTALAPLNTNTRIHTGVYPLYCTHPVHTNTLYTETGHMLSLSGSGLSSPTNQSFFYMQYLHYLNTAIMYMYNADCRYIPHCTALTKCSQTCSVSE